MSITDFQRRICRLIADQRRRSGESYLAGGLALNTLLQTPRVSRDIDLFHDTEEALKSSWTQDRSMLSASGLDVQTLRESPSFVEAMVADGADRILVQWARDSAFRFFPLIEDETFGLVLHPFDLATNKVLALAGRLEARDWLDAIESDRKIQPLGYLVWAACGKDPGFGPSALLAEARRGGRYSQAELDELDYDSAPPSARACGEAWHSMLRDADRIVGALPTAQVGKAVLTETGWLYRGGPDALPAEMESERLRFHEGRIRGAWPTFGRPL